MKDKVPRTFWGDFLSITIKSTYLCNLKCKYCYQKGYNFDFPYKVMPDDVVDATIKELSTLPVKIIDLQWIGGETTIPGLKFFKNVCRLSRVRSINSPKILNQIQTNASLINDAWCKFFIENSDIFSLSISHDFFEDLFLLNQSNINATGIIRKIKKNILKLRKYDVKFGTLVTINSEALKISAKDWFSKWVTDGFDQISLQFDYGDIFFYGSKGNWKKYIIFLEEIFEEQLRHNKSSKKKFSIRESLYLYNKLNNVYFTSCHSSINLCSNYIWSIDLNGDIFAVCDAFVKNPNIDHSIFQIGNIFNDDLINIKNKYSFKNLQEKQFVLRENDYCFQCKVYRYCRGGCPVFKSIDNKLFNFNKESDYCHFMQHYYDFIINPSKKEMIESIYG